MKFECGDLERALAVPELMQEARQHLKECATCRRELRLWNEISAAAKDLHQEWESPDLWPRIRQELAAQPRPKVRWWTDWKIYTMAASVVVAVVLLLWLNRIKPGLTSQTGDRQFLTEQALQEVERSEAAYRQSIDKLYRIAEPKLDTASSPLTLAYREKLVLLDNAIADIKNNIEQNRFNASLQMQLAALYREKQQTLEELIRHDQRN